MKRVFSLLIIAFLVLSSFGCTASGDSPWSPFDGSATEAPSVTDAPAATEAPAPTDEPAVTDEPSLGTADLCVQVQPGSSAELDIDFDGLADKVELSTETINEYGDIKAEVTVTRGAAPSSPYTYTVNYCYDVCVFVVDCDPADSRMEVLVDFVQDSEDYTLAALRVDPSGAGIDLFEDWYALRIDDKFPFTSEYGFLVERQCDVLGTRFLSACAKVTEEGIVPVTDFDYFDSNEWYGEMTLKRDMNVRLCDDNGDPGEYVTVPAGSVIMPNSTDCRTYVYMELEDGTLVMANIEVRTGENEWGIFIDGVSQDEYFDIMYAD